MTRSTGNRLQQVGNIAGVLVVISAVFFAAWVHYQVVERGYELVAVRERLRQLRERNETLKTEVATLQQPDRLERLGRQRFGLRYPGVEQKVIIK
ncbi:MAG: cell division protein FtsL [Deltaproteobacteria bacterium]|nr:cell division protein FtsL [Candidatus Anaeroferrophillacea bacterium]